MFNNPLGSLAAQAGGGLGGLLGGSPLNQSSLYGCQGLPLQPSLEMQLRLASDRDKFVGPPIPTANDYGTRPYWEMRDKLEAEKNEMRLYEWHVKVAVLGLHREMG